MTSLGAEQCRNAIQAQAAALSGGSTPADCASDQLLDSTRQVQQQSTHQALTLVQSWLHVSSQPRLAGVMQCLYLGQAVSCLGHSPQALQLVLGAGGFVIQVVLLQAARPASAFSLQIGYFQLDGADPIAAVLHSCMPYMSRHRTQDVQPCGQGSSARAAGLEPL